MLTVVKCRSKLYYVIGATRSQLADRYLTALRVDTGAIETLSQNDSRFQYFVDDKGHKLDLNFKKIKEK